MKLLALIEGHGHVCYRYRLEAFAGALAEAGWSIEAAPLARGTLRRGRQLRAAAEADVVVLQRKLLPLWQLGILRRAAKRLVYDFDDAVYCRDSYHKKGPTSWSRLMRFWATLYVADAVIAGNEHLESQAGGYVDAKRVIRIPTCVDPSRYPTAAHQPGGGARLVWIGQQSTMPSLQLAEASLAAAARHVPELELRVICDAAPRLRGVRVAPRRWSQATEAAEIADADIGISWLPDDPWSEGKCGLKVLQYMAAGLPVVANPLGMNRELIEHGESGFLASTPEEWAEAIARLAGDRNLRRAMGSAGRGIVENHYSVDRWSGPFARLIDRLPHAGGRAGIHATIAAIESVPIAPQASQPQPSPARRTAA